MSAEQFLDSARVSSGPLTDPGLPRRAAHPGGGARDTRARSAPTPISASCCSARRWPAPPKCRGDLRAISPRCCAHDYGRRRAVFEAIVLASPGGLGSAEPTMCARTPTVPLLEAMREAAGRDSIARQYVTGFDDVFDVGLPARCGAGARRSAACGRRCSPIWPFLPLSRQPCGAQAWRWKRRRGAGRKPAPSRRARRSRRRSGAHRACSWSSTRALKQRGINPGTSADLTVACLLVHILGERTCIAEC